MESSSSRFSAEEVISKLKDDGDFDRLRLKIIRKLKEDEDLRNSIISMVKQSETLNRQGADHLKPRQLSDAIHEEIGDKVMAQISDGVWTVIRSSDGMKSEITDTVKSVYDKLANPKGKEVDESSLASDPRSVDKQTARNDTLTVSISGRDDTSSDSDPKEPPGFSPPDHQLAKIQQEEPEEHLQLPVHHQEKHVEGQKEEPQHTHAELQMDDGDPSVPPGFGAVLYHQQPCDGSDDDPDVPPGFG
ncbi:uncharacterized protein LOC122666189 [Telopea speciosissima]|uniref:uncharacterized protein LOC122666189 n=1 Tax=Telopea speciosissima TaxID=54955 RepID=UPI001CC611D2|nr:uncharacterized protein LOC122666189 [Telopea speciosissima]XP_043718266.1 uncharacterized protein LOC122666189 [Telopea speciosissima]